MSDSQIVKPNIYYKDSYVDALNEGFRSIAPTSEKIAWIKDHFDLFLQEEENLSSRPEWWQTSYTPVQLPNGDMVKRVPCTMLWLVSGDRFIGEVAVRHMLTPELEKVGGNIGYNVRLTERRKGYGTVLLQAGLEEAQKIGLHEVLITCNDDNIGSIKLIEAAEGILKDKLELPGRTTLHRRYIVNLNPQ